jgi:site-specific recombinase
MPTPLQLDALLALPPDASRERAIWVYDALRYFLDAPTSRTERLSEFTAEIEAHPRGQEIRDIFRDFWSHHSYVRVISEAGMPDQVFLLRELLGRALRHLMPVDEVQGDLYVLLDSLDLHEADAQWVASLPDSLVEKWADVFSPSPYSILASCKLLALRATNVALSRDFLALANDEDVTESGFFDLPAVVAHVVKKPEDYPQWEARRESCETQIRQVTQLLEERGSSASMVFRARLLRSLLWRIQQVLNLQRKDSDSRKFVVTIVHADWRAASSRKQDVSESTTSQKMPRNGKQWVGERFLPA